MIQKKTNADFFRYYKKNSKNPIKLGFSEGNTDKTLALYRQIVNGFTSFILDKVVSGYDVELSGGRSLGILGVRGRKPVVKIDEETGHIKNLFPDWDGTKKLRTKIATEKGMTYKEYLEKVPVEQRPLLMHTNEHSNGLVYSFRWSKARMNLTNKSLYVIRFSERHARDRLVASIRSGAEYMVVDNYNII
jgi:hypothetical protein